jgi:opacity protein-like surface antigen
MRPMFAVVAVVVVVALGGARRVAGDPSGSRVLTAPTAWLAPAGAVTAMLGLDHRGDGTAIVGYGLGQVAELEIGGDTDVRACAACAQPSPLVLGRAAFRIGAAQDTWFGGMPAIVLGVRTSFAARGHAVHEPRATDAYAVASRDLGTVRLHAGVDALSASVDGLRSAARLRPLAGVELHPPMYRRSSLLVDLAWLPTLDAQTGPALGWAVGVGVRYQAFPRTSVELAVRARQGDDLGASTVMVRVNAVSLP